MPKIDFASVLFASLFFSCIIVCNAQEYDDTAPPNSYQNEDNPHYWKNKLPHAGYWQQDVHYNIKADIDEKTNIISATEELTYWNNSPDTLTYVYFHLYQNAFQPGSYLDNLQTGNGKKTHYGIYESQGLGTVVSNLKVDGQASNLELDNTILKVHLPSPMAPGTSKTFTMDFKTYFDPGGNVRRRMKVFSTWGYKQYDGVHWYPRIAVYDRKFGWTKDQHLGREFYGDFGTYNVELTFAANFVVDATGTLQNRDVVLPPELRQKLDIKNFKDKPWNQQPSVVIEDDSTRKTWIYYAENVHDFAFTADPTYRIGEAEWNGVKCIALAQEPHASGWQNAADYTAKIIQIYSEDIGMYVYPKMIVADAKDGMEYPMLTLDSGKDPSYRGLLAHEVGHNWFFGQVGNNETYRAALDEGFTQFLTAWCLGKIEGKYIPRGQIDNKYLAKYKRPQETLDARTFGPYLKDAIRDDAPAIDIHSDGYNGALRHGGGYRHVYYKTASMLYNLQYVLGDEMFLQVMKNYFADWKIAHPYWEDFIRSVNKTTKSDFQWFFDQWISTSKNIDYAITHVRKGDVENEYIISLKRKGRMQMPIDLQVIAKDGSIYDFHIPNHWYLKETNAKVLPKWHGWDLLHPTYEAKVMIPGGIKSVEIDPSGRLADVNKLNNARPMPSTFRWDSGISNSIDYNKYEFEWRPDVWYNSFDGVKAGLHLNGHFQKFRHVFKITAWYNSSQLQGGVNGYKYSEDPIPVSFNAAYSTTIHNWLSKGRFFAKGRYLDGLMSYQFGVNKMLGKSDELNIFFKSMHRYQGSASDTRSANYLIYPELWSMDAYNNTLNLDLTHPYKYSFGNGKLTMGLRSSFLYSANSFATATLESVNDNRFGNFDLRTRVFGQLGTGIAALESQLYLAGGNPESMMDNAYTRAEALVPSEWVGNSLSEVSNFPTENKIRHFHTGGGLNLRGYAGYLSVENDAADPSIYKGMTGAAINAELEFDRLFRFQPKFLKKTFSLDTYLFGDIGTMMYTNILNTESFSELRMDAGVGAALTIKRFGFLNEVHPLTIRFDMPLLISHVPFAESGVNSEYLKFRWLLAINRAF